METRIGSSILRGTLAALVLSPFAVNAQYAPPAWNYGASELNGAPAPYNYAAPHASFSQQQLEQMLAPIALYPDNLLSQVLIAATMPDQVAQAAQWTQANPSLRGENAVGAAQAMGWDPSVAALAAFPQLLAQMNQNPQWTRALGQAFYADQGRVMDAVQGLRHRAQVAGTLRSDDQLLFQQNGAYIGIESAVPYVTYLPYYDPLVAYGAWPWASYPPVYWRPWAGYRYRPGYRFAWGPGVRYSAPHRSGRFDWTARRFDFAGHRPSFQRRVEPQRAFAPQQRIAPVEARRDFGRRAEAPRVQAPQAAAPQAVAPRVEARTAQPRFDGNRFERRFEGRRFEERRGVQAAPAAAAPAAPAARPSWQDRRQQREAARAAPAPAPAPAAAAAAPAQPRERGQGHHRDGRRG